MSLEVLLNPRINSHLKVECTKIVGEQASLAATKEVKNAVDRLQDAVAKSEEIFRTYQTETVMTQWKIIGVSVLTCIVTCLLLVWWLIPSPTLPLTNEQLSFLEGGRVMQQKVWPKLTKKEQERYLKLTQ